MTADLEPAGPGRPTILLVHGAWHGPWCWDLLRPHLETLGYPTVAVQLPSATASRAQPPAGLDADTGCIVRQIDRIDGPVALVGHSYGGAPVTAAAAARLNRIAHLIYLAAYLPDSGESIFSLHGVPVPADLTGVEPVPDNPVAMFYGDVPADTAAHAAGRLAPQTTRSWTEPVPDAGWRQLPSTYLVCQKDQALPPALQEQFATRADHVRRLPSGHSPFLSMPAELAAVLHDCLVHGVSPIRA